MDSEAVANGYSRHIMRWQREQSYPDRPVTRLMQENLRAPWLPDLCEMLPPADARRASS